MHTATLVLDDGSRGSVNMQKEGRWKVNDEVEITHEEHTSHGIKWKVSKPGMSQGTSYNAAPPPPATQSPELQLRIDSSWAINQVLLHSDFTVGHFDTCAEEIILASRKLLSIKRELMKRVADDA